MASHSRGTIARFGKVAAESESTDDTAVAAALAGTVSGAGASRADVVGLGVRPSARPLT